VCFNLADGPRCRICEDERRDAALICVIEEPGDVVPIERTHEFHGRYHVLGGALSPIDGVDPEDLKIAELLARVDEGGVREVVLATNPTTTGEATALHIADALRERAPGVAVTRLASGLPIGADLEYADELTLGRALSGRRTL
jgi:recombination protein RecR